MNILFFCVDDLRPNLGCYGDTIAVTPNLDKLAQKGVVFNNAYCQQSICNPSRATLMTGKRPESHGVWDLKKHFRETLPEVTTLPQLFKQNGYYTQAIGKVNHNQPPIIDPPSWCVPEILLEISKRDEYLHPENRVGGFIRPRQKMASVEMVNAPDSAYADGQVVDAGIQKLRELKDRPFFLALGFKRPHLPFTAPKKYWDLYNRGDISLPVNVTPPKGAPNISLHDSKELRGYKDIPDEGPISDEKVRELRHGYYACTSFIDAQVGRILNELETLNLHKNTIIVFWVDHGFHLGEHGLWAKRTGYELDVRIPLIISVPGQQTAGSKSNALVELVDLYPTLADLCNLPVNQHLEGTSMKPLIQNPNRSWKKAAFSQAYQPYAEIYTNEEPAIKSMSIRTVDYRYIEWFNRKPKK